MPKKICQDARGFSISQDFRKSWAFNGLHHGRPDFVRISEQSRVQFFDLAPKPFEHAQTSMDGFADLRARARDKTQCRIIAVKNANISPVTNTRGVVVPVFLFD